MHKPAHAFMTWLDRPADTVTASEIVPAAQWFVIITLATLFFLLGCFATLMWVIWRRTVNPPPHVRLLMELADEEVSRAKQATMGGEEDARADWERDADWWRGGKGESKAS